MKGKAAPIADREISVCPLILGLNGKREAIFLGSLLTDIQVYPRLKLEIERTAGLLASRDRIGELAKAWWPKAAKGRGSTRQLAGPGNATLVESRNVALHCFLDELRSQGLDVQKYPGNHGHPKDL